jgi:hypothetical protein
MAKVTGSVSVDRTLSLPQQPKSVKKARTRKQRPPPEQRFKVLVRRWVSSAMPDVLVEEGKRCFRE